MSLWARFQTYRSIEPNPETASAYSYGWWLWLAEGSPLRAIRDVFLALAAWGIHWALFRKVTDLEQTQSVIVGLITLVLVEVVPLFWYVATAASKQRDKLKGELRSARDKLSIYDKLEQDCADNGTKDWEWRVGRLEEMLKVREFLLDNFDPGDRESHERWGLQAEAAMTEYRDEIRGLCLPEIVKTIAHASPRKTTRQFGDDGWRGRGRSVRDFLQPLAGQEVRLKHALEELQAIRELRE